MAPHSSIAPLVGAAHGHLGWSCSPNCQVCPRGREGRDWLAHQRRSGGASSVPPALSTGMESTWVRPSGAAVDPEHSTAVERSVQTTMLIRLIKTRR